VKLLPNAILEVNLDIGTKAASIELHPSCTATRSTIANFPGVFIVNTQQETEDSSGPIFAAQDPKEAESWMRALNYARFCRSAENQHPHPLTLYMPNYLLRFQGEGSEPRSAYKLYEENFTCSGCQKKSNYLGGTCEFCNFKLCSACQQGYQAVNRISHLKSPHHDHELLHFDSARSTEWFDSAYNGTFSCDVCKKTCDGGVYHCPVCSYDECEKCAVEHVNAKSAVSGNSAMQMELGLLSPYSRVDENEIAFDPAMRGMAPQQGSVITNTAWDLSKIETEPVPHAYCEFKMKSFTKKVCIGIGNTTFVANQMLGYQQNSMAYFSDGSISRNNHDHHDNYLPRFSPGDTIGVGVLYDSFNQRRLFFTKNGQMLEYFPYSVHKGMDAFPGVGFVSSGLLFATNFKGPFMFDPTTIPNYRADTADRLDSIPKEVVVTCLCYAATSPGLALHLRQVSKKFAELSLHNYVWRDLFCARWPRQNPNLKMKSWFTLYKRRYAIDPKDGYEPVKLIENCDFDFLCPLKWENLPLDNNENERHCDKCNKTVYRVDDEETLRKYSAQGRCVSMFKLPNPFDPFGDLQPPMMGMPPPMPRYINNPF
jgi:hypothetical protein